MKETSIKYFPLDFDSIKKGDAIDPSAIEDFANCKRDTEQYRFAVQALKSRIARECRARGKLFVLAEIGGVLRVLTDEEAAEYTNRQVRIGFRKQVRHFKRQLEVDATVLPEDQRKEHERRLLVNGKMIQAARSARAAINAIPHQRQLPGIPKSSIDSCPGMARKGAAVPVTDGHGEDRQGLEM